MKPIIQIHQDMSVLVTGTIVPKKQGGAVVLDTVRSVAPTTVKGAATKGYTDSALSAQFARLAPYSADSGFSTFLLSGGATDDGHFSANYSCSDHVATITWSAVTLTPNGVTPSPTTSTSLHVVPEDHRRADAVYKSHQMTNGGVVGTGMVILNPNGTLVFQASANWAGACSVPAGSITYIY